LPDRRRDAFTGEPSGPPEIDQREDRPCQKQSRNRRHCRTVKHGHHRREGSRDRAEENHPPGPYGSNPRVREENEADDGNVAAQKGTQRLSPEEVDGYSKRQKVYERQDRRHDIFTENDHRTHQKGKDQTGGHRCGRSAADSRQRRYSPAETLTPKGAKRRFSRN
jgi:hypothetical protein